jgi:hypothetical protein
LIGVDLEERVETGRAQAHLLGDLQPPRAHVEVRLRHGAPHVDKVRVEPAIARTFGRHADMLSLDRSKWLTKLK